MTALALREAEDRQPDRAHVQRGRVAPAPATYGPAALLHLQRTAGNAAVAWHLRREAEARGRAQPRHAPVQRCGPVPCDCSDEERAEYDAAHPESTAGDGENDAEPSARPVQRAIDEPESALAETSARPRPRAPRAEEPIESSAPQAMSRRAPTTPGRPPDPTRPVVQRLTDPLGADMVVDWTTPNSAVALTGPAGAPVGGGAPLNFNGGDSATFAVPDRTSSANLDFSVTGSWHGKGSGPTPPGPNQNCDVCKILIDGASAGTCAFVADVVQEAIQLPILDFVVAKIVQGVCIPIVAAIGSSIQLLPADIVKACKSQSIDQLIDRIRELKENIEKNTTFTTVIDEIVKQLRKVPGFGQVANIAAIPGIIRAQISKRLGELIEKLKEQRDKCRKGGGGQPAGGGQGQATSRMRSTVFIQPDGQVRAVGPGPAQIVSGTGATEESPVRFSQDGIPNAALVAQVPTIVASGPDGAKAGHQFTVTIQYGLPPVPKPIDCPAGEFFPFVVAKDQFEDELAAQKSIRDWYFGHDPEIRSTVETGAATVKITGRASNTGKVEFNRQLADKRAKRTEAIVRNFAGSDSSLRIFSTGFLTAQEPGEVGRERRSEAKIIGEVPADRVAKMRGGEPCVGHNNESSDQGLTGPQTSAVPGLEGPGSGGAGGAVEGSPGTGGAEAAGGLSPLFEEGGFGAAGGGAPAGEERPEDVGALFASA